MLLTGWLAACDGSPAVPNDSGLSGDAADDFKGCSDRFASFAPGLQAAADSLTVTVIAANPEEPERYLNGWTVELSTRDGSPATEAEIVRGQTFMPVHGHDGGVEPRATRLAQPGLFRVERLNFSMRGPWEVRFWLRSGSRQERAVFDVCVAK